MPESVPMQLPPRSSTPDLDALSRLEGLPPVVSANTVVLVLGSFPGAASLRLRQYYAHPQNQFWKILQALWPQHPLPPAEPHGYAARCDWLLARRLGLWDVYESCVREGSLDASIRHAQVNDFSRLQLACPQLAAVAHNGGESFKHAGKVLSGFRHAHWGADCGVDCDVQAGGLSEPGLRSCPATSIASHRLPSTSPAHASWSFERKCAAWAALMAAHGLL
jgi:hypoxanthine-DNA glycosylase